MATLRKPFFIKYYLRMLERHPTKTMCLTTAALHAGGDVIAQKVIEKKEHLQWLRTGRFFIIGLAFDGPLLSWWYRYLSRVLPGSSKSTTALKVALDQGVFIPGMLASFLILNGTLKGLDKQEIKKLLDRDYFSLLLANYQLWPLAMALNFYLMPLRHQVLFTNSVSLAWNTFMSWKANKELVKDAELVQEQTQELTQELTQVQTQEQTRGQLSKETVVQKIDVGTELLVNESREKDSPLSLVSHQKTNHRQNNVDDKNQSANLRQSDVLRQSDILPQSDVVLQSDNLLQSDILRKSDNLLQSNNLRKSDDGRSDIYNIEDNEEKAPEIAVLSREITADKSQEIIAEDPLWADRIPISKMNPFSPRQWNIDFLSRPYALLPR